MENNGDEAAEILRTPMNFLAHFPLGTMELRDEYVCWSRMQAEAGQHLESIVARKEIERKAGKGIFTWGVGNAPATIASRLARAGCPVPVIFSVMKSKPKAIDLRPARTFAWRRFIDLDGVERPLPSQALVTSRGDNASGAKRVHYALICRSEAPLELRRNAAPFHPGAYRNAGGNGAPVGSSQVTAILKRVKHVDGPSDYEINLKAWLVGGFWVRLTDPIELSASKIKLIGSLGHSASDAEWLDLVEYLRAGPPIKNDQREIARLI